RTDRRRARPRVSAVHPRARAGGARRRVRERNARRWLGDRRARGAAYAAAGLASRPRVLLPRRATACLRRATDGAPRTADARGLSAVRARGEPLAARRAGRGTAAARASLPADAARLGTARPPGGALRKPPPAARRAAREARRARRMRPPADGGAAGALQPRRHGFPARRRGLARARRRGRTRRAAGCTPHGCFRPPELRMATAPRRQAARASRVGRRPGRAAGVDPVTTEIVLGALETICYEMAAHVSLTATTPLLNQSNERNATILDATGQLAALSVGIPQFMLSSTLPVRFAVEFFGPDGLFDGDVIVANDPYHGGGHLPDYNVFAPVFHAGECVLIASIQCHHADTGGGAPGGYHVNAPDTWAEGARWPDGVYESDAYVDHDPHGKRDIHVHCAVTVRGSDLTIDFTGSDDRPDIQAYSTFGNTRGYVVTQLASMMDPSIPKNEGFFDAIELIVPKGCCLNPPEGKSVAAGTHHPGTEVGEAVAKALERVVP